MPDVPYFKPHEEGPLFPEDAVYLGKDVDTFLATHNRDMEAEVAGQNIKDISESSFRKFAEGVLADYIEKQSDKLRELLEILTSLGEDSGFDEETIRELSELTYEEAFANAYSYICQTGLDPDEVLAGFIEDEAN